MSIYSVRVSRILLLILVEKDGQIVLGDNFRLIAVAVTGVSWGAERSISS